LFHFHLPSSYVDLHFNSITSLCRQRYLIAHEEVHNAFDQLAKIKLYFQNITESKIFQEVPGNLRSGWYHRFQLKQRHVTPQIAIAFMQNTSRQIMEYKSATLQRIATLRVSKPVPANTDSW
jgi:hypothetical protein